MVLSPADVRKYLDAPFPDRLVITPILHSKQIDERVGAVDLRLGQEFLTAQRGAVPVIDPLDGPQAASSSERGPQLADYLRREYVPVGGSFVLHPRHFALAATLEYLSLPPDLAAYVIGRSRWARVGLVIAMATFVHPTFKGCLTLELQNLGDVPLVLHPGLRVAQLILHSTSRKKPSGGTLQPKQSSQFSCATGPEFPMLVDEEDRALLDALRGKVG